MAGRSGRRSGQRVQGFAPDDPGVEVWPFVQGVPGPFGVNTGTGATGFVPSFVPAPGSGCVAFWFGVITGTTPTCGGAFAGSCDDCDDSAPGDAGVDPAPGDVCDTPGSF